MRRRTPYNPPPKLTIRELRKRRAAHAVATVETRVNKLEQELASIEHAIEVLRDQVRVVQGQPQTNAHIGPIRQQQPSLSQAYAARRWELQREADVTRQRLETERRTLEDLKRRLSAEGNYP
jgi:chromosome segregation ATPase